MKKDYLNTPILITGASRSGASMIGEIVRLCGVFAGKTNQICENTEILNNIVRPYLQSIGTDPNGQYPLPNINELNIPISWTENVLRIIAEQGNSTGTWMYKSSSMCLMYPIWNYAFPNAKWIIVRRKDDDIVESCMHTTYMNAFNSEENQRAVEATNKKDAWYWWVRQHNRRFAEMVEYGLNCKQIHPERMVNGDYSQIQEMLEWLGLQWDSKILNLIEPKLGNSKKKL